MESYYLSPKATKASKETGPPGEPHGTPGSTRGQQSPSPRSSPAPGGSTSPATTPEDILRARIDRAEAKRELLVRKTDLLALEAQLHELDLENRRMEEEYAEALSAIGARPALDGRAMVAEDGAPRNSSITPHTAPIDASVRQIRNIREYIPLFSKGNAILEN